MVAIHNYKTTNQESRKTNENNEQTKIIITILTNIITALYALIDNISSYERTNRFQYFNDTTNWNITNHDTPYQEYNTKTDIDDYQEYNIQNNVDEYHEFFKKHNDISTGLTKYTYDPSKDGKCCFNCRNDYYHQCCMACKRTSSNCECVYVCGLSEPCQYDKHGEVTQYRKCKWYTSNPDNFVHNCKYFDLKQITKFKTKDSRSFYHQYNIV